MQIMFGTILCVLLKGLILTKATMTPKDYTTSNILQEESESMYPDLNFTQDISVTKKSDHHILNFNSDRSYFDNTMKNKREDDEVISANISNISETIKGNLSKPTSLRAFVQFGSQFTEKVNNVSVTLRWNHPEFTDEIIQGYTVQCSFFEDFKETCDYKNMTTKLEHTVHNLKPIMTYYFRVRAYTKVVAGPYTEIRVSTMHENPIPKLLFTTREDIQIWDMDLKTFTNFIQMSPESVINVAYSIQEYRIYWITRRDLMTLKINENNITKINSFDHDLHDLCIDWVARNLYLIYQESDYSYVVKFDLTIWENGIIKFDNILKSEIDNGYLNVSPFIRILYSISYNQTNQEYDMMKYHLDGKNKQIIQINASFCLFHYIDFFRDMIIDNMNNEPLIYWLSENYTTVTDINVSMCNTILHNKNVGDNIKFKTMTIDKTNIYILAIDSFQYILYVLKKEYVRLKSVNAVKYVEKILISSDKNDFYSIYAFDKSLQPYPPIRCLIPYEKVYNFENVNVMGNSIIVNLPEPVVKRGCKKYNLPATIYTISVDCLNNNLNRFEKFNVKTFERYYEIQNLTPFTMYKLKFTLSNFYFDKFSINLLDLNGILMETNSGNLNAPENISVLALTPTIAVVYWMPPKQMKCVAYEVHWKSVTLVNNMQQESKQFINMPKRMADGRFFTKINLPLPIQYYLIYMRMYPINFSDFYNESLSKIVHTYSEPNIIILSEVNTNSMNISWISNINLTISSALEYKEVATEKWQRTNYVKINYNKKVIYHIENLQSGTSYNFRLILRYLEYEEKFIWPADERFIFSTLGSKRDVSDTPGVAKTYYLPLIISSIVTIIVIVTIICLYRLYRQRRSNNEQFLTMTDLELSILPKHVSYQNIEFNTIYNSMLHYNPDECAITKIARKQITFTKLLGSGTFGMVFQGKVKNLESSDTETFVAIKTLRKDASSYEKKKLFNEAILMNHFRHKHILRLLAVCLDGNSPLLVLELMETGDLLKYLRDCRNLASDSHALRLQDLFAMCEDVARGCCYLEQLRVVHRDLACRNCLVSSRNRENRVIKIGDFGLSRDVYKNDYYRMKGEGLLPIRWMAPESLMIEIFTSLSDVWSFGVLMWEITSLGEKPYVAKTDEEVINYVRAGGRLPITLNCPSPLYQLMLRCWSAANARPNFKLCLKDIITLRENIEDALLCPVDLFSRYN